MRLDPPFTAISALAPSGAGADRLGARAAAVRRLASPDGARPAHYRLADAAGAAVDGGRHVVAVWHHAGVQGLAAMVAADDFRWVADWIFLGAAALTVLISFSYLER